jgi:hypothetical protein
MFYLQLMIWVYYVTRQFIFRNFEMNDLSEASYVLGI